MKRKAVFFLIIMITGTLLSGCGLLTLTSQRMQFTLDPSGTLGYTATPEITITERNMKFRNAAGATGLQLTGYKIYYYDAAGNEIDPSAANAGGSLDIFVPPGIRCDDPDEELGCTILSEGAVIQPGYEAITTEGYNLLDVGVAQRHLDTLMTTGFNDIHWYAEIVFYGFALDSGASFETTPYQVKIAPPN
jgi:hypothetical protein